MVSYLGKNLGLLITQYTKYILEEKYYTHTHANGSKYSSNIWRREDILRVKHTENKSCGELSTCAIHLLIRLLVSKSEGCRYEAEKGKVWPGTVPGSWIRHYREIVVLIPKKGDTDEGVNFTG